MRISDWSSDVCSSDLEEPRGACADLVPRHRVALEAGEDEGLPVLEDHLVRGDLAGRALGELDEGAVVAEWKGLQLDGRGLRHGEEKTEPLTGEHARQDLEGRAEREGVDLGAERSEEHTSELQSLMRISYAVFCL